MSSGVAVFLDRCTQIICKQKNLSLGWKNNEHISDSRPHLLTIRKSIDWTFVDVKHQL